MKNSQGVSSLKRIRQKLIVKNSVIKNFFALTFLFLGAVVMSPVSRESDGAKLFLAIYSLIVVTLSFVLIFETISKTMQADPKALKWSYSSLVLSNAFFGLLFPLIFIQYLLNKTFFDFLGKISDTGSTLCDIRFAIIDFYKYINFYELIDLAIKAVGLGAIVLFFYWAGKRSTK
ncbi:MAG: hypothetical protein Kow0081_1310 [Candidatus Dojkabacteria bacterium]